MPPTMILIGVCACAGAADMSEADIAARTAAARILRMVFPSDFLWRFLKYLPGLLPLGQKLSSLFGGHEASHATWCQPRIWGAGWVGAHPSSFRGECRPGPVGKS